MLTLRCTRTAPSVIQTALRARTLATPVANLPTTSTGQLPTPTSSKDVAVKIHKGAVEGALRPHLNIPVNPNHGLYAFFRQAEKDGKTVYETIEPDTPKTMKTGRSWIAKELRLKSFKDLHTLWYILLRERNLLATQAEEARRTKIRSEQITSNAKAARCRKTMARIKYVINERRLSYDTALQKLKDEREAALAAQRAEKAGKKAELLVAAEAKEKKAEKESRKQGGEADSAANLAAGGLFESVTQGQQTKGP